MKTVTVALVNLCTAAERAGWTVFDMNSWRIAADAVATGEGRWLSASWSW